jgi:hypothetical protein
MKKKHITHLFLGIALLASSLTGYGMESDAVIGKQKGEGPLSTDKLEEGEYFVSKKMFKKCFKHFLNDNKKHCKDLQGKDKKLMYADILENSLKQVFDGKTTSEQSYCDHFEKKAVNIKKSLKTNYLNACKWVIGNTEKWAGKFHGFLMEQDHLQYKSYKNRELLRLLKGEHLDGFLKFLSNKKDIDQELHGHLKNIQGSKIGIFQEKNKSKCAEKITKVVLASLRLENKADDQTIRYKFYNRFDGDKVHWSYCVAYVDLKVPMGTVYFYNPKGERIKEEKTNIFAMVFGKDSQDSFQVSLEDAYPWLGRESFLKARDKAGDQNADNLVEQMESLSLEVPQINDDQLREFFGKNNQDTFPSTPFFSRKNSQEESPSLQEKDNENPAKNESDEEENILKEWFEGSGGSMLDLDNGQEVYGKNVNRMLEDNVIHSKQEKEEDALLKAVTLVLKKRAERMGGRLELTKVELKKAKEAYQCLYAENCFLKTNQKQMNVAINAIRIELQETKKTCDFLQKENLALNNTQKKVSKEFYQEEDSDLISRDELEFLKKAFSNLEKDYDSLDKERKKLDMAFKKLSRRFKEYVCCFFLISVPGVMIFMRLGAHTFFQDQEYCSM